LQGFDSIQKIEKQNKANGLNPPTAQLHRAGAAGLHSVRVAHVHARSWSGTCAAGLHSAAAALTMATFGTADELGEGAAMEGSVAALLGSGQDSASYTRGRSGVRRDSTARRTRCGDGTECGTAAGFGAGRSAMTLTHDNGGRVRTAEAARCSDSAVDVARSESEAAQLRTRASVGRVGVFMARARWQCQPGQPIRARCVAA
jgi:hypothetical protein